MRLRYQVLHFSIIGSFAFLVDVGVLYALHSRGIDLYTARVFSFIAAATFSWAGNRLFTFRSSTTQLRKLPGEWFKYLAAMLLGGSVNYAVYSFAISQSGFILGRPWIGVAAGTAGGLLINFMLARKILYLNH